MRHFFQRLVFYVKNIVMNAFQLVVYCGFKSLEKSYYVLRVFSKIRNLISYMVTQIHRASHSKITSVVVKRIGGKVNCTGYRSLGSFCVELEDTSINKVLNFIVGIWLHT